MNDPTQAPEGDPLSGARPPGAAPSAPGAAPDELASPGAAPDASAAGPDPQRVAEGLRRGLFAWLVIVAAGGVLATLMGHVEGALLFAGAGAYALAQASDSAASLERYRAFVEQELPPGSAHGVFVRTVVGALVPLAGALFYALFCAYAWTGLAGTPQPLAGVWCAAAALACVLMAWRPAADRVARTLFGGESSRTRRLTARLVVMVVLLPVPATWVFRPLLADLVESGVRLADPLGLVAQLLGEIAIALAGVGWLVGRGGRATLARLGLSAMRPGHVAVVVVGVATAIGLNAGTEWIERHAFPALWQQDAETTRLIAGQLTLATALLLGVCAGVGEEVVVRGALQPRLGIVASAIVFACGHVQYSWFGMVIVGLLGVLLGVIRARTNTTTAIAVHVLYDVFAAASAGG